MKKNKILKVITFIVLAIVLSASSIAGYVYFALPANEPVAPLKIEATPARLARGEYLATHVAVCVDCHSTRDYSIFSAPIVPGTYGQGGEIMDHKQGFPGEIHVPNITPATLQNWSDGEVLRAITTGVNKDGKALFPLMGYQRFGKMDKEDIYSIIAYIRSLKPIKNVVPKTSLDFPVNLINNTSPKAATFSKLPDENNTLHYGEYLVNAAGCVECHSIREKGAIVEGTEFGGGMEFIEPAGIIRSSNITMNKENGIGNYSKEDFVRRFKGYTDSSYKLQKLTEQDLNTPMPWMMYGGMKTSDLEAIYAYLKSLKPIDHLVIKQSFTKK